MSSQMRQFLTGAAVVVALLVVAADPPPAPPAAAGPSVAPEPLPRDIVAPAAPLAQYGTGAVGRLDQQLASVNAMWRAVFAAAGERYVPPRLAEPGAEGCNAPPAAGSWAGLYCRRTRSIVVDPDSHARRQARTGGYVADVVLGYIVAHEVGHHVQTLRSPRLGATGPRYELHADCLAGVWGKAAGLPLPPTWKYAADAEHGTSAQRMRWLSRGWLRARPADCDAIFAGEPL